MAKRPIEIESGEPTSFLEETKEGPTKQANEGIIRLTRKGENS